MGRMRKYLELINHRTLIIIAMSMVGVYTCLRYNYAYSVDWIFLSIAVLFPLVFTIREAFRRRQLAIRLLSQLKAAVSAFYFGLENNIKMPLEEKLEIHKVMMALSDTFISGLKDGEDSHMDEVRALIRRVYMFASPSRDAISGNASLKLMRPIQDIQESIENLNGVKMHGTPVSLRAYCLLSIYLVPFIFTPTVVYNLYDDPEWLMYALSALNGFVLMSLYNLQDLIEDPFDQMGLDDIKLTEFLFSDPEPTAASSPTAPPDASSA
jgi:predicted membrane chloride channel (bestrophin family)